MNKLRGWLTLNTSAPKPAFAGEGVHKWLCNASMPRPAAGLSLHVMFNTLILDEVSWKKRKGQLQRFWMSNIYSLCSIIYHKGFRKDEDEDEDEEKEMSKKSTSQKHTHIYTHTHSPIIPLRHISTRHHTHVVSPSIKGTNIQTNHHTLNIAQRP